MATVYSLRGESELMRFDRPDTTYFDTHFLRALLRARIPLELDVLGSSSSPATRECSAMTLKRSATRSSRALSERTFMRNDKLWLNLSYEPGYRDYPLDGNELYSDFYLNRFSVMGSLSLAVPHDAQSIRHP